MNAFIPVEENRMNGGVQRIYRFDNGYGASVIRHSFSYGGKAGLWEIAVLSGPNQKLDYSTPITDDVLGNLNDADVEETLSKIAALPKQESA